MNRWVGVDRTGKPSLRVSMALASLEEVVNALDELDGEYRQRRRELVAERDDLIRDAADSRVAITQLQSLTYLSRSRIWQIRADAPIPEG